MKTNEPPAPIRGICNVRIRHWSARKNRGRFESDPVAVPPSSKIFHSMFLGGQGVVALTLSIKPGNFLIGVYVDAIAYFSFQILIPLKTLGFQTAANPYFESVIGYIRVFGFQPVNDLSKFRFIKQSVHFLKKDWISSPGVLVKNQGHDQAATNHSHDNGPHYHDHFAPLHPWLLAPEKKFSQQAKG
jgi:hypothetical protein